MMIQQCERCKKKDTYPTGGKPTLFLSPMDSYCIMCNKQWAGIEATMRDTFNTNLNTRRDKYFKTEGDTP